MGWIAAGGYDVALDGNGKVICRNAAGRKLRSVPSKLADEPAVIGLRQLAEWLARHERECLDRVETWMIRSLPVPAAVLAQVWPDPAWRSALRDLVVVADTTAGFLRDADTQSGIGLVDLDGDTVRIRPTEIRIPHPVLLEELDELREFAVELEVEQGTRQLFREVWRDGPEARDPHATAVSDYEGGTFKELRFLKARATGLGYRVRGGQAVLPVVEAGHTVEARIWLGDDDPYYEAETGPLTWTTVGGAPLRLGEVGPVAWSEGMRMAAALYAGREIEDGEQAA
ncbi:DUF4132 domain-containing protein [Streptomyces polyrhachis]|uniref:DUF4132 domain-containing protein n=1 Tax=Streptomyces polyrhachis TaxID=1282885 RepID=A0ABW2GB84_9ACTN